MRANSTHSIVNVAALLAFAAPCSTHSEHSSYHSLTREFAKFVEATQDLPTTERVARFKEQFNTLLPGFYEPSDGQPVERFDASVARALVQFPDIQTQYEKVEQTFPSTYATSIVHFQKHFPGFQSTLPVWFIHSLGRMDGGTRSLRDKTVLIFGADVIARIHSEETMGPFMDHELFHVENGRWFKDCVPDTAVWCALWQEGAATYAASVMNPGATDKMLLLDQPKPIRAAVDAQWRAALCALSKDLEKNDRKTYESYFFGGEVTGTLPRRSGYYLGYRLLQRVGSRMSLAQIDRLDNKAAHQVVTRELTAMVREAGGCELK